MTVAVWMLLGFAVGTEVLLHFVLLLIQLVCFLALAFMVVSYGDPSMLSTI
jgi:hypothetical protein